VSCFFAGGHPAAGFGAPKGLSLIQVVDYFASSQDQNGTALVRRPKSGTSGFRRDSTKIFPAFCVPRQRLFVR